MDFLSLLQTPAYFYTMTTLFALCVGSLLNVVISRLPQMLNQQWHEQCCELMQKEVPDDSKINLFFPRSFCPKCNATIKAWQNIPIISYLLLRGRCHSCKQKISIRYPLIEAITTVLSLLVAYHFGLSLLTVAALLFTWLLICLCLIDFDTQLLPDGLTYSLLWLGLLFNSQELFISLNNAVLSAAGAYLVLWLFMQLFYLITGKIGMGHGDFKLLAALGAWLGWQQLPFILIFASFTGAIVGILYLNLSKQGKDTPIPFGPFLCIAGFISLLWGKTLLDWYLTMVLS